MPRFSVGHNFRCFVLWVICANVIILMAQTDAISDLAVPQQVSLSANSQQLSISWLGGASSTFDLMILRTELNETAFYDTLSVTVNQASGRHQWNWTSAEPLECTSLSVRIRSRDGQTTSDWSETQILQGKDIPSNENFQIYPVDEIVPVGSNTTFCCIVEEGKDFGLFRYAGLTMNTTRLSRRTYATTAFNQGPSDTWGTNIVCYNNLKAITGTVVFVGYPPLLSDFECETHDLITAVCHWTVARDTHLYGKRETGYSMNGRVCPKKWRPQQKHNACTAAQWEGNWTLVAVNPLGQYSLTDSAEISHRVYPVAPVNVSVLNSGNVTVAWQWTYSTYSTLPLVCQLELSCHGSKTNLSVSGVGLRSVVLSDLLPDEDYSVKIRCGAQENFWKWGNWSPEFPFKTNACIPDAPDVWIWMKSDHIGQIVWKPLTRRQSHGQITSYEVTLWSPEENIQHTQIFSPDTTVTPVNLTQIAALGSDSKVIITITANNSVGSSPPASIVVPLLLTEPVSMLRVVSTDGGFPLSWRSDDNATCGFVVEWVDSLCTQDCSVEWIKLAAGNTNITVESEHFQAGVRYNFSVYSCSSEGRELLERRQGYLQELVPSSSVVLSTSQQDSDVVLTWGEIPVIRRRGFLLGYNVYNSSGSELKLLANLPDKDNRSYTVKGLSEGSHKFTVKAYTSAGEDTGATASITLEPYADWLILEILTSFGFTALFLVTLTYVCYKKRKWVKKAFYPDIPEPKLPSDWSRTQGPLDIKPSSNSLIHIVEKPEWDSSKEALVVIPEEDEDEDGQGIGDEPVDTDEPTSLRYYNQVVDDRPIRPRYPDSTDSSASSLDSARTDVTYTGIQTSGSSLVFQMDPPALSEAHQPLIDHVEGGVGGAGGGYRPQMQARAPSNDIALASPEPFIEPQAVSAGGYKPQSSWHLDSPVEAGESGGLAPSLGSPTSVASTQFLLPDGEEQDEERRQPSSSSATTWFTNLLSSTKP